MMQDFKPKDLIAVIVILGAFTMEISGHDGPLAPAVALIIGYYFGHRTSGVDDGE